MPVSTKPKVHACIFDCDGLLLNTEDIYFDIECSVLARFGLSFNWDLNRRMMGLKWKEATELLFQTLHVPATVDEYYQYSQALYHRFMDAKLLPGVDRLVKSLKEHQVPLGVASSSTSPSFKLKTTHHQDFFALFDTVVLGDDAAVMHGKPYPDIFLTAANRLSHLLPQSQVNPAHILAFEDSPNGVMAARAAGMPVIWIPHPCVDTHLFCDDPLVFRLSSMAEFNPVEFGLPALVALTEI